MDDDEDDENENGLEDDGRAFIPTPPTTPTPTPTIPPPPPTPPSKVVFALFDAIVPALEANDDTPEDANELLAFDRRGVDD